MSMTDDTELLEGRGHGSADDQQRWQAHGEQ